MLPSIAALTELISACRLGSNKYTEIATRDIFHGRLAEVIETEFSLCDRKNIERIQTEGSSGLLAARARNERVARAHFVAGQRLFATLKLSRRAHKLAESMFFAQKAYDLYVRSQFSNAIKLLQRAYVNDLALEAEPGFGLLAMHRIQLVNNWMRVEAQRGRWQQALALGISQLQYLEAPEQKIFRSLPPPWNRGWNRQLRRIPEDLKWKMHAQGAAETVSLFQDVLAAQKTSAEISDVILRAAKLGSTGTQIGRWIDFQVTRLNKSLDECCFAAGVALRYGCVPSSPLWLSVAEYIKVALNAAD